MPRLSPARTLARVLALTAPLALAACAAAPPRAPEPLRDTSRPIYSTAAFNAGQLVGTWRQVAEVTRRPGCGPGGMTVTPTETELVVDWQLCFDGTLRAGHGALTPVGPGRFRVPGSTAPWWVLWQDADARTLVLGTPDGSFGVVLDKGTIAADRLRGAQDVLVWNGYDRALLSTTP